MNWYKIAAFGNFEYKLPQDKQELLYDFYMASFLYHKPEQYRNEQVYQIVQETKEKLVNDLRQQMIDDVFFILSAEFRHIFDRHREETGSYKAALKHFIVGKGEKQFLATFYDRFLATSQPLSEDSNLTDDQKEQYAQKEGWTRGRNPEYDISYHILKGMISETVNTEKLVKLMKKMFLVKALWNENYGGKPWADIADGWILLNRADSYGKAVVAIDHLVDLQHNTSTLFNKLKSYEKNGDYRWVTATLDHKAKIVSPYEIMELTSPNMKRLAARAFHETSGSSVENDPKAVYEYWVQFIKSDPTKNIPLVPEKVLSYIPRELFMEELITYLHLNPLDCVPLVENKVITADEMFDIMKASVVDDNTNFALFKSVKIRNLISKEAIKEFYLQHLDRQVEGDFENGLRYAFQYGPIDFLEEGEKKYYADRFLLIVANKEELYYDVMTDAPADIIKFADQELLFKAIMNFFQRVNPRWDRLPYLLHYGLIKDALSEDVLKKICTYGYLKDVTNRYFDDPRVIPHFDINEVSKGIYKHIETAPCSFGNIPYEILKHIFQGSRMVDFFVQALTACSKSDRGLPMIEKTGLIDIKTLYQDPQQMLNQVLYILSYHGAFVPMEMKAEIAERVTKNLTGKDVTNNDPTKLRRPRRRSELPSNAPTQYAEPSKEDMQNMAFNELLNMGPKPQEENNKGQVYYVNNQEDDSIEKLKKELNQNAISKPVSRAKNYFSIYKQ